MIGCIPLTEQSGDRKENELLAIAAKGSIESEYLTAKTKKILESREREYGSFKPDKLLAYRIHFAIWSLPSEQARGNCVSLAGTIS